jgi:DNA helicase-2/ATP-dependent DNA helicase PcrA
VDLISFLRSPLDNLDPDQRAAASAVAGGHVVVAGAGTGKTRTLTARIGHLVRDLRVDPTTIVGTTFTNKAAREIRDRAAAAIGDASGSLRLGTFHSLGARILRRHAVAAGFQDRSFVVLPQDEAAELVQRIVEEQRLVRAVPLPDRDPALSDEDWERLAGEAEGDRKRETAAFAREATRAIARWKSWGLTAAMVADPRRGRRDAREEAFASTYMAYQRALEARNMADFGDLVLKALVLLEEDPRAARVEAGSVSHLLVDEAQDANAVQVRFARALAAEAESVFAVGDENQNIMAFQGAFPGAMKAIAGPGATVHVLTRNRRCTDEILRPANEVVRWNRAAARGALVSGRSGRPPAVTAYDSEVAEAHGVAKAAKQLVQAGTDPSRIAVLVRSAWVLKPYEEAFVRAKVPFSVVGGRNALDREEAKDVVAFLRLATSPRDDLAFRRIANKPARGLGQAAVESIVAHVAASGRTFHEACVAVADAGHLDERAREGLEILGEGLGLLYARAAGTKPDELVAIAVGRTGYEEHLDRAEGDRKERRATVAMLRRVAREAEDLTDFLETLALMSDLEFEGLRDGARVRISTIHAAKGLEFDEVFLPCWEQGVFPNPRAVEEGVRGRAGDPWNGPIGGGVDEERRLAHVGLTRARHGVHVSYATNRIGFGAFLGAGPSALLAEADLELTAASNGDLRPTKASRGSRMASPRGRR